MLFPPLTGPDEPFHAYRAFALTAGDALPEHRDGGVGSEVPVSLVRVATEFRASWRLMVHPEWRVDRRRLGDALRWELAPDERTFAAYPTAAQYPPVVHLPQAAGMAVGRLAGLGPVGLVYLGRLSNLVAGTLLVWWAVRLVPLGAWAMCALALTPTALALRASLSADASTTAAAFVLVAAVARLAWGVEPPRTRDRATAAAAAVFVCLTKLPYALLVLTLLVVPRRRLAPRADRRVWTAAAAAGLLALGFATWLALEFGADLGSGVAVDRDRQVRDALADPVPFLAMVGRHYALHGGWHVQEAVGAWIGWMDVHLPLPLVRLYAGVLLGLVLLAGSPHVRVEWWQRLVLAGVVVSVLLLVAASQYATWTAYGAEELRGLQGRYFLPAAPLVVLALHRRPSRPLPSRAVLVSLGLFAALVTAVAWWEVYARHWS